MRYALPRAVTATEVENVSHRASYILWHDGVMAHTITFRPDEDARRALSILTEDGTPVSVAVRRALIDAAHTRAHQRLRAEAKALAADEKDRAEVAQVLRDMETLRAW
jgi:hypothetical protein